MIYRGKVRRRTLGARQAMAAAVLLTGFYTLVCLWIQPNSLREVAANFLRQPLLIVLNCLPLGALIVGFALLLGNVFSAAALAGSCWAVLSLANTVKLTIRDEPVFPRDLSLLKEALTAAGSYHIQWPWLPVGVILCCLALMLALARFFPGAPLPGAFWRTLPGRLLGLFAPLAVLIALLFTLYASDGVYNRFAVSNAYYIPSVFNELGFPYCFCHQFTKYTVDKPAGYSRARAESWETGDLPGQGAAVNVVVVMNEAFSDVTDDPAFTWPAGEDPLTHFHELQADPHALSGQLVIPSFAGGTASTEFDVLTGMQGQALSPGTTSPFRAVNRNLDSLLRVFALDGYRTLYLHPGDDWFYNRENVLRWLGAEEAVFIGQMENVRRKGGYWVSDDYVAEQIETRFASAADSGELLFSYATTIQNHMSYTADKYSPDFGVDDCPSFQTAAALDGDTEAMLRIYAEGVRDADSMLGRLASYFSRRSEPVVLAFFGDHLPYLGDNGSGYGALGIGLEEDFRAYRVPYVIWANDAAAAVLDWEGAAAALELPEDGTISACFFGSVLLELTGRGGESPWFSFSAALRRELPVLQKELCRPDGGAVTATGDLPAELQSKLEQMRCWTYYKMKVKTVG